MSKEDNQKLVWQAEQVSVNGNIPLKDAKRLVRGAGKTKAEREKFVDYVVEEIQQAGLND